MTAPHNKTAPTGADDRYPGTESEGVRSAREITKHMPLGGAVPTLTARAAPRVVNSIAQRQQLLAHMDRLEQTLLTDPPNPPAAPHHKSRHTTRWRFSDTPNPPAAPTTTTTRAEREPMTSDPYLLRP